MTISLGSENEPLKLHGHASKGQRSSTHNTDA